jgi:hypothetical protein
MVFLFSGDRFRRRGFSDGNITQIDYRYGAPLV